MKTIVVLMFCLALTLAPADARECPDRICSTMAFVVAPYHPLPLVEVGACGVILGPVTFRTAEGEVVLSVPRGERVMAVAADPRACVR